MTKYVVFAGNRIFGNGVAESKGYLERLTDEEVLKEPIRAGDIRKDEDIDFLFPWDSKIKDILQGFGLELSYIIVRAEVLNEKGLEESIPNFKIRYGYSHHTIYES